MRLSIVVVCFLSFCATTSAEDVNLCRSYVVHTQKKEFRMNGELTDIAERPGELILGGDNTVLAINGDGLVLWTVHPALKTRFIEYKRKIYFTGIDYIGKNISIGIIEKGKVTLTKKVGITELNRSRSAYVNDIWIEHNYEKKAVRVTVEVVMWGGGGPFSEYFASEWKRSDLSQSQKWEKSTHCEDAGLAIPRYFKIGEKIVSIQSE